MKFTKLAAIEKMREIGSHTIFLENHTELVNAVCEPFDITPVWSTFQPEDGGKGPQPNTWDDKKDAWDLTPFKGVDGFWLAQKINRVCGGKLSNAIGRGTAYRQDLDHAENALRG